MRDLTPSFHSDGCVETVGHRELAICRCLRSVEGDRTRPNREESHIATALR